jgi:2'-5' RNA ligase
VQRRLAAVQAEVQELGRAFRPVRPEGLHLTLAFLGQRPDAEIPALGGALRRAASGSPPFRLGVAGLGIFPSPDRPRVLWAGLTGDLQDLDRLRLAVWGEIEALSIPLQRQPFRPHITLARGRETKMGERAEQAKLEARLLRRIVSGHADEPFGEWTASEVSLMQSELLPGGREGEVGPQAGWPGGARYSALAQVRLAETGPDGRRPGARDEVVERGAGAR